MTFNRNDFLDWVQGAQENPMSNQYKDHAKEFVNPTTNTEIGAINSILDGGGNILGKDKNIFRTNDKLPLEEAFPREVIKPKHRIQRHGKSSTGVDLGATIYHGKDETSTVKRGAFVPPKYADSKTPIRTLKPTPGKALEPKDDSPIFKHQGTEIRPSDVQAKARDKRIAKIAKRTRPMDTIAQRAGSIVGRIFGKK